MTDPTPTRDEAVPTGWKFVPVEPTEEMIEAMREAARKASRGGVSGMTIDAQFRAEHRPEYASYAAMLASAPAPASGVDAVAEARKAADAAGYYGGIAACIEDLSRRVREAASLSPAATPTLQPAPDDAEVIGGKTEALLKRDGHFLTVEWWRHGKKLSARIYEPFKMKLSAALADVLALALEERPKLDAPAATPVSEGEPVAWQRRFRVNFRDGTKGEWGDWHVGHYWDDDGLFECEMRPVYLAKPSSPAGGDVAIAEAIGTSEFMDPPDGGDVPLVDQVRRMAAAYKRRGEDIVALMAAIDAEKAERRQERAARVAFLGAAREALNTSGLTHEQVIIADNAISDALRRVREEARHDG